MDDESKNVNLTLSKLNSLIKLIPSLAGFAYLCGFVIINSYLAEFEFFDQSVLSAKYLIAGLGYIILVTPLALLVYANHQKPTDNLSKNWRETLGILLMILWYSMFVDLFTYQSSWSPTQTHILVISLLVVSISNFYLTSYASRDMDPIKKFFILFGVLLAYHTISIIFLPVEGYLKFIILLIGIGTMLILNQIGDGEFHIGRIGFILLQFLLIASMYGAHVYDKMPSRFGGGNFNDVHLVIDKNNVELFDRIGIELDQNCSFICRIIYYTENEYLIRVNDRVYTLGRNKIESVLPLYTE